MLTHLLSAGEWRAVVDRQGALIRSLSRRGQAILHPMAAAETNAVHAACFPLLPFANRIANASLRIGDQRARIEPALPERHGLHGVGWRRLWALESSCAEAVELSLRGGGDEAWPWRWQARQRVRLDPTGLSIILTLRNEASVPAPASLGLHPAFVLPADATVTLDVDGIWDCDAELIPNRWRPVDWASLREARLDNCLTGWTGQARIEHADGMVVTLTADTDHLQVYRPAGAAMVCLEPVTVRPNAWSSVPGEPEGPPPMLEPGKELSVALKISAEGGDAG